VERRWRAAAGRSGADSSGGVGDSSGGGARSGITVVLNRGASGSLGSGSLGSGGGGGGGGAASHPGAASAAAAAAGPAGVTTPANLPRRRGRPPRNAALQVGAEVWL